MDWRNDPQKPSHFPGLSSGLEMGPVQMSAASLRGTLLPEFHRGSEGLLETSRVMICNSSSGFSPPGGGCGCQRVQDQEHHAGPAFHFVAITKIIKFRPCLLLLALGIISGAPPLPPWLFPHGSSKCFGSHQAPADVRRSCSSRGVNGWPCCRTQGGESVPSCMDLFSCFFWHQAFHHESASWKHP